MGNWGRLRTDSTTSGMIFTTGGSNPFVFGTNDVERMRITGSGDVGIGTATVPHGSVGAAKLAVEGTNASLEGPHIQFTTASDDYPLSQMIHWTHDNLGWSLDAYWDGSWRSSDAGSNFQIFKLSDIFRIRYDSGIAQGNVLTWNEGITLDTSGQVGIGTASPSTRLDIDAGAMEFAEMTAPAAGAANTTRTYAEDNAGTTRQRVKFSSGNAVTIAEDGGLQTYTPSNVVTDRSYDADATSVAELADVLGTLIADFQAAGVLG